MLFVRRVEGNSMQPTYKPGSIVFGMRWLRRPRAGMVVVADHHGREIIKRVSDINAEGLFLLGDNPLGSTDSRVYGRFRPHAVKGVIIGSINR